MHHYQQFGPLLVKLNKVCKFFNSYTESLQYGVCKLAKYVRNCVVFWKNLHSWQKFYTTAGRDGRDKFQVWLSEIKRVLPFLILLQLDDLEQTHMLLRSGREFESAVICTLHLYFSFVLPNSYCQSGHMITCFASFGVISSALGDWFLGH